MIPKAICFRSVVLLYNCDCATEIPISYSPFKPIRAQLGHLDRNFEQNVGISVALWYDLKYHSMTERKQMFYFLVSKYGCLSK